jgi:hypothetical protein
MLKYLSKSVERLKIERYCGDQTIIKSVMMDIYGA